MNHPEDEKAAEKYATDDRLKIPFTRSDYIAFLAGCRHIRTSAEWKAMEKVVAAARIGAFHHSACRWNYSEECCCAKEVVTQALDELDRIRKEGESG